MRLFTIPEACAVAGLDAPQTLRNWISAGLLKPARRGTTGTGNGHRLSFVQVLALAAGMRYRHEGASPDRVAGVVAFLSTRTLEWLEAEMEAGRTFPVPAAMLGGTWLPGMMIAPPAEDPEMTPGAAALMRRLDLKHLYDEVTRKAEKMSREPGKRRGRKRARARTC